MEGRAVCWRFSRGNIALALALLKHCKGFTPVPRLHCLLTRLSPVMEQLQYARVTNISDHLSQSRPLRSP
jgi:hypothetical protein